MPAYSDREAVVALASDKRAANEFEAVLNGLGVSLIMLSGDVTCGQFSIRQAVPFAESVAKKCKRVPVSDHHWRQEHPVSSMSRVRISELVLGGGEDVNRVQADYNQGKNEVTPTFPCHFWFSWARKRNQFWKVPFLKYNCLRWDIRQRPHLGNRKRSVLVSGG